MTARFASLAIGVLLLGSCDQGVQSLTDTATPVARIQVRLANDPGLFQAQAPTPSTDAAGDPSATVDQTMHMRIGLLWLDAPSADPLCLQAFQATLGVGAPLDASQTAVVKAGCEDVFAVAPFARTTGQPGPSVAVTPGEVKTITLLDLPSGNVLIGKPPDRVGYAALVLFDDRDQSGELELPQVGLYTSLTNTNGDGKGGGPGGGGGGPGMMGGDKPRVADYIYGATFVSMAKPNTRLVYREGAWGVNLLLFYPFLGCAAPQVGMSWLDASGPPNKSVCQFETLPNRIVDLSAGPTETVRSVACRQRAEHYREPPDSWKPLTPWACISKNEMVVAADPGACKGLTHLLIKGCSTSATCKKPEWGDNAVPPTWWPCNDAPEPKTK